MTLEQPQFQEGQRLTAALFKAEQASRIERLATHVQQAHFEGVVSGLEIGIRNGHVEVQPGTALMASGDVICVTETQTFDVPVAVGSYAVLLRQGTSLGRRGEAATAEIGLGGDETSGAIRLGAVTRAGSALTFDPSDRQLIGATGNRVTAPGAGSTLSLGLNESRAQAELAVAFGDNTPVLTLSEGRGAVITGHLSIRPDLTTATALSTPMLAVPTPGTPPEAAKPWSLRRVQVMVDDQPMDELRLELHHPGKLGDPALNRLVVGSLAATARNTPALTGITVDAEGQMTILQDGEPTFHGIEVIPPGRIAFAPVSPGPTDPAFAAALTDAMLQGVAWSLLIATINSGITGVVFESVEPAAGVAVTIGERTTITDSTGRFFLAAVGWPGETVMLDFSDGDELGSRPAVVGAAMQAFNFEPDSNNGDII